MRIVYDSFHGRFSDNPRALYDALRDRPDTEHVWLADPAYAAGFPDDVTTVDISSAEATKALESADLVFSSSHVEVPWEKQAGTTYVQCWHGTPLKRVHRDVLWAPEGRLDELDLDIAKWDLLLSPNPTSTRLLRHAFRWEGPVLESGYPRNDTLVPPAYDVRRAQVRERLGIAEDQRAVLYAPTWRDAEGYDPDAEVPLRLDLRGLGLAERDVLLVRAHNMVSQRWQVPDEPWALDVSTVPADMADLHAAADVLITDYSSAMFDFALTGRPILYFVPDLEAYADRIRGVYFDLWPDAPGPQLRTTADVAAALRDLDSVAQTYAAAYATFRQTYTGLEDGQAAQRVIDHLGL